MKICAPQSEFHDEVIAQVVQAQLSVVLFSIGFVSADCRISRKRGSQGGRKGELLKESTILTFAEREEGMG